MNRAFFSDTSSATGISSPMRLIVRRLKELAEPFIDVSLQQELAEFEEKISAAHFYLVILGMFKRGKSSLINRLLEKEIAPIGVIPLTAIITLFEYAAERYAEVIFSDSTTKKIAISAITDYVTEEYNPTNEKGVRYVKIFDNAPLLRQMHMVDTPGLGSEFEHNTQTTLSFVPKIDAALFVISADTPVSQQDLLFLKKLRQSVPRILIVLNKSDIVSGEDLKVLTAYNKSSIAKALDLAEDDLEFFTVSCLPALQDADGNIAEIRSRLEQLADYDKKEILQETIRNRFLLLRDQVCMQLRLRLNLLQMPINELREKQERLHASIAIMKTQHGEFDSIIQRRIRLIQDHISNDINELASKLKRTSKETFIKNWSATEETIKKQGHRHFEEVYTREMISQFNDVKCLLEQNTKSQFKELLEQYSHRSQSFLNELSQRLDSMLGIDFRLITEQFDLDIYTSFYFDYGKADKVHYIHPSFISNLFNQKLLRRRFLQKLYKHYRNLITVNSAGIIYDLQYKIQESFRKFNYDLNQHLESILIGMEQIIRETITARSKIATVSESEIKFLHDNLIYIEHLYR